jgi:steroid delta-isomerase-like uncharacterized protein
MSERNKSIVRRLVDEVWNRGQYNVANELVSASYVNHDPMASGVTPGPGGLGEFARKYRAVFPDLHVTINAMYADGETVITRFTSTGTHRGPLDYVAPTNRSATISGIIISRLSNGRIEEDWSVWDALGLMQQLGVVTQARASAERSAVTR